MVDLHTEEQELLALVEAAKDIREPPAPVALTSMSDPSVEDLAAAVRNLSARSRYQAADRSKRLFEISSCSKCSSKHCSSHFVFERAFSNDMFEIRALSVRKVHFEQKVRKLVSKSISNTIWNVVKKQEQDWIAFSRLAVVNLRKCTVLHILG